MRSVKARVSFEPLHSFCLLRCLNVTECLQGMACFYVSFKKKLLFILLYYYDYFLCYHMGNVLQFFFICVCV